MKPLIEINEYRHKEVSVIVRINHLNGTVSLMERDAGDTGGFISKKWVFSGRELDYMHGWQNILDAMKYAITEATKVLEKSKEKEEKEKTELMIKLNVSNKKKRG